MSIAKIIRCTLATLVIGISVSGHAADAPTVTPVKVDENSFRCIRKMTPVRHFYVDNLLGNTD